LPDGLGEAARRSSLTGRPDQGRPAGRQVQAAGPSPTFPPQGEGREGNRPGVSRGQTRDHGLGRAGGGIGARGRLGALNAPTWPRTRGEWGEGEATETAERGV